MKRLVILLLIFTLLLVGCGKNDETDKTAPDVITNTETTDKTPEDLEANVPEDSETKVPEDSETKVPEDSQPEDTAHSHSYTSAVTNPTCEAKGYTTYTCTCGYLI